MDNWQSLPMKHPRYQLDVGFYDSIRAARSHHKLVDRFLVSPGSGRAFVVKGGQTFRVIEETGPQIGSIALWNEHEPQESFIAARTMSNEGFFVKVNTRLWSDYPWNRPMVTCTADTVVTNKLDEDCHHHPVGTHCSPELLEMRFGALEGDSCRVNLLRAIEERGLKEEDLRDSVYVHRKVRIDERNGKMFGAPSDGKAGDYVEFYAEMDLLVAVSVCPFGDGSGKLAMREKTRPLAIEIYDTGTTPKAFPGWTDWRSNWSGRWIPPEHWGR